MARIEKTVFISYRRTDISWALAVYQYLTGHGFDVFFDYTSIPSGDFEQIIVSNIRARAHFVLILTPTALDRCSDPNDWLRREIETALDEKRNIIPLFFEGFNFGSPSVARILTGKLDALDRYNGLEIPSGYFLEAMERLRTRYLNVPLTAVIHPVPEDVQKFVEEEQVAANQALEEKKEDIEQIVKPEKPAQAEQKEEQEGLRIPFWRNWGMGRDGNPNSRLYGIGAIILVVILGLAGISFLIRDIFNNPPGTATQTIAFGSATAEFTPTTPPIATDTSAPSTDTPPPPNTAVPTAGIGSTILSEKDGMVQVFVPGGEFEMGSEASGADVDEPPVHRVTLDAYWIDRTEVTNAMYTRCMEDGGCSPPVSSSSHTRDRYFGDPGFDVYPVLNVSWEAARAYCAWAGRRLPTEAEWEKAAGWDEENQAQRLFPWGDAPMDGSRANFCDVNCPLDNKNSAFDDGFGDTAPVGSYPAGASFYGALDMAGNVWEWVEDWYEAYPGDVGQPQQGFSFGTINRVVRGGSWFFPNGFPFRSTNRTPNHPDQPNNAIGFRCAESE